MRLTILAVLLCFSCRGADWYITPAGTGNGTLGSPGHIYAAVWHTNWAASVTGGDTIWLRAGVYSNANYQVTNYYSWPVQFSGSLGSLVTWRSYPGETARADGLWTFTSFKYHRFRDLEFYDSHKGQHVTDGYESSNGPYLQFDSSGASGNEWINNIIHDIDNCWSGGAGGIVRGNICWNIGNNGYEHFSYASATNVVGNIVGWIAGGVINQDGGNSLIASNIMWETRGGIFGITANDLIIGNRTYQTIFGFIHNLYVDASTTQVITNNTIVGDGSLVDIQAATSIDFRWNTIHMHNGSAGYPTVHLTSSGSGWTWDRNAYTAESPRNVLFDYSSSTHTFAQWKSDHSGFDGNSTSANSSEPSDAVYVYPNADEAKRAHIAIYNWSEADNVSVSLTGVLNSGDTYQLYSAQNYNAGMVKSGTYDGTSISVPLTNLTAAPVLYGTNVQGTVTSPEFAAFVVKGDSSSVPITILTSTIQKIIIQ